MSVRETPDVSLALSYLNMVKILRGRGYTCTIAKRAEREATISYDENDPIKATLEIFERPYRANIPSDFSFYNGLYTNGDGDYISIIFPKGKKMLGKLLTKELAVRLELNRDKDIFYRSYTVYVVSTVKVFVEMSEIRVLYVNYHHIAYYIANHIGSSKYEILEDEEKDTLYKKYGITDSGMIHILNTDPAIMQNGWVNHIGSVVRITTDQEMEDSLVNVTIDYRLIVEDL